MQSNNTSRRHPVFGYAAYDGVYAGVYFLLIVLAMAYSSASEFLGLLAVGMMVAVPVLTYRLLRKRRAGRPAARPVSTVWIEGVYTYLFGSLLMALGIYLWLRIFDPGFIQRQIESALELTAASPETAPIHDTIRASIAAGGMPTAINAAIGLFWPVAFSGSVISLVIALLMRATMRTVKA